jgi:hypothetical protein
MFLFSLRLCVFASLRLGALALKLRPLKKTAGRDVSFTSAWKVALLNLEQFQKYRSHRKSLGSRIARGAPKRQRAAAVQNLAESPHRFFIQATVFIKPL